MDDNIESAGTPMDIDEPEPSVDESESSGGPQEIAENQTEEEVNLKEMADDYAKYLVVNSKADQTALDDRIDGVYTRVDEFKQQLYFLHQNITSSSEKMQELQDNSDQLIALFQKIDQMETFMNMVSRNVDHLEEAISKAEKDLEPSRLRKVFTSIPGFGKKTAPKPEPISNWTPPRIFRSNEYFSRGGSGSGGGGSNTSSPTPSLTSSSVSSFSGQVED